MYVIVTSSYLHGESPVRRGTELYQVGRTLPVSYHELFLSLRNRTQLHDVLLPPQQLLIAKAVPTPVQQSSAHWPAWPDKSTEQVVRTISDLCVRC
jgi:hypothetical protein